MQSSVPSFPWDTRAPEKCSGVSLPRSLSALNSVVLGVRRLWREKENYCMCSLRALGWRSRAATGLWEAHRWAGLGLPGIEHTQAVPYTLLTELLELDSWPDTGKHSGSLARTCDRRGALRETCVIWHACYLTAELLSPPLMFADLWGGLHGVFVIHHRYTGRVVK